jgi:hypothetical protein
MPRSIYTPRGRKVLRIYTTLTFLALQGAPYIYDISRLRFKLVVLDNIVVQLIAILVTLE